MRGLWQKFRKAPLFNEKKLMTIQKSDKKVLIVSLVDKVLISEVEIVQEEINNKTEIVLKNPFTITGKSLSPFLSEYTNQRVFHLQPSKIITFATPNQELYEKYENLNEE
jgi:hypothetical protein